MTTPTYEPSAHCKCVSEHRPAVLQYQSHHIFPTGMGGPDSADNRVWLCPTAHANVHELLRLILKAGRTLTDRELEDAEPRTVSRYAADLAREGYRRWQAGIQAAA